MTADRRFDGLERRELAGGLTILVASTLRARRRGLARLDALAPDHALALERCRCVQTIGMRFALDLLWIDAEGGCVRLDSAVPPRRVRGCRQARAVVECNAGEGERFAVALAADRRGGARRHAPAPRASVGGAGRGYLASQPDGSNPGEMMREGNGESGLRDQPVADLIKQLTEQTKTLVTQEIELAKAELGEKGKKAGLGAGMFGGAGLLGFFAFALLTACVVLALATAMEAWLAALIVALLYGAIAGGLALSGRKKVQEAVPPVPEQTIDTVKEDVQWTKERAQAGRR
jgi:uncharacterized membrane protein (UPF0127 family)/uncharacterized membrane protein YqjE